MKNSFSKLIPIAAAIGLIFAASSAQAFTLTNGSGTTFATGATTLDWNQAGSGVAKGIGPLASGTALQVGTQFQFLYQANLVGVDGNSTAPFRANLDANPNGVAQDSNAFEFTIVARLNEYVKASNVTADGLAHANFGLQDTPEQNKLAIFYDTRANANTATGTGFDDGTMIALLTIIPGESLFQFEATSATTAQGAIQLHAMVNPSLGDFINTDYLQGLASKGLDLKLDANLDASLDHPAGSPNTSGFHKGGNPQFADYNVDPGTDIVFKDDASSTLSSASAVPEPGSTMLLGLGMVGLLGASRRRKTPKA